MSGKRLRLNGIVRVFQPGQTLMEVADEYGCYIPHLCYHPDYPPHGSCRLCTLEVDGRFCCACTTGAEEGMEVTTDSPQLEDYRRQLTELLFAEANHLCPACERSGNCQLQAVAYEQGMDHSHFTHTYPARSLDASHDCIVLDRDRCILCGLCVRASERDGKQVFAIAGRGSDAQLVVNSPSGLLKDSALAIDDRAAHICPVGALLVRGEGFQIPPGQRLYDQHPISQVGHRRPAYTQLIGVRSEDGDHD